MDGPNSNSGSYNANFASSSTGPPPPPRRSSSPLFSPRHSDGDTPESLQSESFYAILNLDRSASEAEIRYRYRSLASTFHPDRQRDEASRRAAHARFQDIQRAYEVLIDSHKRAVYDLLGEQGLQAKWDIGHRNWTPEELRRHFQKQYYESKQQDAEALVRSTSDTKVVIDARGVFLSKAVFQDPTLVRHDLIARLGRIQRRRVTLNHSFVVPFDDKLSLHLGGTVISSENESGANINGTIKHQFSPRLWGELKATLLDPRILSAKMRYVYDEHTSIRLESSVQTLIAPPRVAVSVTNKLYPQTSGYITYKTGFYSLGPWGQNLPRALALAGRSSLTVGLTNTQQGAKGWTIETQAGLNDTNLTTSWSTRAFGLTMTVGGEVGLSGDVLAFVESQGRITSNTTAGVSVSIQLSAGVIMQLNFNRLGQKIQMPILLSHDLNPYVLLGATAIPALSYMALYRLYLLPKKKRRTEERVKELREEYAEHIARKKQEAEEATQIMERNTATRTAQERAKHGLIIISAQYGRASAFTARGTRSEGQEDIIDVTIPIQALVDDSKLVIPGGRGKFNLLGFWDPCIGENKKLRVRYLFRDALHEVTVDDLVSLKAPQKVAAHVLNQ